MTPFYNWTSRFGANKPFGENSTFSTRPQAGPVVRLYPLLSLAPRPESCLATCAPTPWCLGVLAVGCPGALTSDLCALGGDSCFGLDRGRALLAYKCHLGGVCCRVMHAWCLGLVHVRRPGRRVAGCSRLPVVQIIMTSMRLDRGMGQGHRAENQATHTEDQGNNRVICYSS